MDKLNTCFTQHSGGDFLVFALGVHHALTSDPGLSFFPNPSPAPAALLAAAEGFSATILLGNAPGAAADRKKARSQLSVLLKRLAHNLVNTSGGDGTKLAHTGFRLRKKYTHHNAPPEAPQDLRAMPTGMRGEVALTCGSPQHKRTFQIEWAHDPNAGPWRDGGMFSNSRKIRIAGLPRGIDTYFRVRAFGTRGKSPWSDIAAMMVV